jgi:hypothetical protein
MIKDPLLSMAALACAMILITIGVLYVLGLG